MEDKYQKMLSKLDEMYQREEEIKEQINRLILESEQLQEDKELLQNMIMHTYNKDDRVKKNFNYQQRRT